MTFNIHSLIWESEMHQLFRNCWKDLQVAIDVTLSVLGKVKADLYGKVFVDITLIIIKA